MNNEKQILEALQMQPLSEEEKQSRHILGRLYGPIATCTESTRNGRKYNRELWEKQLDDDIFQEKIANKSLFLELGHPADREETDMEKVCACIPEMPKIVDGDLYAYVDILDTNNGRLLKTLCDYGFVPGISSRGSGDIMDNDEVDPETFFLETWDIVQLPAVKKARMQFCESVDPEALRLRKALKESYDNSTEEDKKLMKETLDNLDINFEEGCEKATEGEEKAPLKEAEIIITDNIDEIPWGADLPNENKPLLTEEAEEEEETETVEEVTEDELEETEAAEIEVDPIIEIEETEEKVEDEESKDEEISAEEGAEMLADNNIELTAASTVEELANVIKDFDKELPVEFKNIEIDEKEYNIDNLSIEKNDEEGKVIIGVNCTPVEEVSEDKEVEDEVDSDDEVAEVEPEDESEEAIDDGDEEVIESLKEAIRQKDALEKEVKTLKNEKTVSDAEVKTLKEEVEKYKTAFARTSELASKSTKLEAANKALQESINTKDTEIKKLQSQASEATKLNESIEHNADKVKKLTEQLKAVQDEAEEHSKALEEQLAQCKQKLHERTILAKKFKAKSSEVLDRYIESKASMLGIRPTEITRRLNENYTMDDIDNVYDDLLTGGVQNTLPFNLGKNTTVKVRESVERKQPTITNPDYGYELDDSLFELAGLKKDQF